MFFPRILLVKEQQHLHLEGDGAVGAAHHAQHGPGVVELVTRLLTWTNNTSARIIYVRNQASDIPKLLPTEPKNKQNEKLKELHSLFITPRPSTISSLKPCGTFRMQFRACPLFVTIINALELEPVQVTLQAPDVIKDRVYLQHTRTLPPRQGCSGRI